MLTLLHIWWPIALGWSVAVVVHRATGRPWDPAGITVLLLGIVAAYSLDRVVGRVVDEARRPRWLQRLLLGSGLLATLGVAAMLPSLSAASRTAAALSAAISLTYPLVKRLPLGKTLIVPLVWTWCGIVLPVRGWEQASWWTEPVALPLFLLFAAGCLLCDVKDADDDRAAGVPSVPALVGPRRAVWIGSACALLAAGVAMATGRPALACSATVLAGLAFDARLLATPDLGPLLVDVVMTLPGVLIATHVV